jgi:aspartate/methionine/tyrosine aminotransferase
MTIEAAADRGFRPFEYMAWAKQVEPGAHYPFNISGLPAPDPSLKLPLPSWAECLQPSRPVLAAFVEKLGVMLGAPGRSAVVAGGASEAITVALAPFIEQGRPVIVENPAYRAMERSAALLGGVPVRVERREADGWQLDPERLDALLAETGARLVGITDPHNPTGVSIDAATREGLVRVVERRGALLVVDEIFACFRGPRRPPAWAAASERVLSLGSLTKGWGLSSLRTGWVLGAAALVERCRQAFDLLAVNPPTVTLLLALAALEHAPQLDAYAFGAAQRVREVFAATDWGEAGMVSPQAGIIGFLRLPPGWSSEHAVTALRERHGIQAVPGHFFGHDDRLRLGFAGDGFDPAEGCRLIAACLAEQP